MNVPAQSRGNAEFRAICWDNREVALALEFLGPLQLTLRDRLSGLLNSYHHWSRSPAYYDLLCGEWLMHFSHVVYAAYLEVTRGAPVTSQPAPLATFADFHDYQMAAVHSSQFAGQLRQHAAGLLNRSGPVQPQFAGAAIGFAKPRGGRMRRLGVGVLKVGIAAARNNKAPILFCHPDVKCGRMEWAATLLKWRGWARHDNLAYPIDIAVSIDQQWRRCASSEISVSGFTDLVCALIPLYIPALYLEALPAYRRKALSLALPRPQAVYTANSLHGHSLFKILAADWREEGTKILSHQHGGGYGIDRVHTTEEYETRVADRFYTLGWKSSSPKQIPLPAALPRKFLRSGKSGGPILLSCVLYPGQVYRIHFQPMPGTIETMIAETAAFVSEAKAWPDLLVRPYPDDYGWGMVKTLRAANPALRLDDMRLNGLGSYARSALVIHNYLGTSWLETLALNIPTVCFYDARTYSFREAAQPYIDRLEAAGVLHRNGAAAARFVSSVMADPQAWWNAPALQDLRAEFVRNYANFSADWPDQWESELRNWIH